MAHGPYWADLPVDGVTGKHFVSPTKWDQLVNNIIDWQSDRDANGHALSDLGVLGFNANGYLDASARFGKSGVDGLARFADSGAVSANTYDWDIVLGYNLKTTTSGAASLLKTLVTHPGVGYRGIRLGAGVDGIAFFCEAGATVADAIVSPTARMLLSDDGDLGVGMAPDRRLAIRGPNDFPNQIGQFALVDSGASGMRLNVGVGAWGAEKFVWLQATEPGAGNERNIIIGAFGGYLGVGKLPNYQLELSTDSAGKPSTSTWTVVSDVRTKSRIEPLRNALAKLKALDAIEYIEGQTGQRAVGVSAQQLQAVMPEAVCEVQGEVAGIESPLAVSWHHINVVTMQAVRELATRIEALEAGRNVT